MRRLRAAFKLLRRVGIALAGFIVLLAGIAMIVLPGPAFIVIPLGLGILSLEFPWAARWRHRFHAYAAKAVKSIKEKVSHRDA